MLIIPLTTKARKIQAKTVKTFNLFIDSTLLPSEAHKIIKERFLFFTSHLFFDFLQFIAHTAEVIGKRPNSDGVP